MTKCNVILDLMPLYVDDACSKESCQFVEEHLKTCESCRKKAEIMRADVGIAPAEMETNMAEEKLLKEGKEALEKRGKRDYIEKMAFVDVFLNLCVVVFMTCSLYSQLTAVGGISAEDKMVASIMFLVGITVPTMFLVWEAVFLTRSLRGKETFVSEMITMTSIILKAAFIVMGCVAIIVVLAARTFSG